MCIDGSFALGNVPVDLSTLMPEYYVGSLDRLCFTPPGTAFLVAQPHSRQGLTPLTVSYYYGQGFEQEFSYYGLQDFSNWLAVGHTFQFITKGVVAIFLILFMKKVCGSFSKVIEYRSALAKQAANLLSALWATKSIC